MEKVCIDDNDAAKEAVFKTAALIGDLTKELGAGFAIDLMLNTIAGLIISVRGQEQTRKLFLDYAQAVQNIAELEIFRVEHDA